MFKLKYLLFIIIMAFAVSSVLYTFDEDSEVSIGAKRERTVYGSVLSLFLYDKPSGRFAKLSNNDVVKTGQRFKISVKNSGNGYIYILSIDPNNTLYAIFPNEESSKNSFRRKVGLTLPVSDEDETAFYQFDDNKGKEIYYIFVSRDPVKPLEKLMRKIPGDGLDLSEDTRISKRLGKLYKRGKKNILSRRPKKFKDNSSVWNVFFRRYYAKRYVFDHQ